MSGVGFWPSFAPYKKGGSNSWFPLLGVLESYLQTPDLRTTKKTNEPKGLRCPATGLLPQ